VQVHIRINLAAPTHLNLATYSHFKISTRSHANLAMSRRATISGIPAIRNAGNLNAACRQHPLYGHRRWAFTSNKKLTID
jgi:hypothetical protein